MGLSAQLNTGFGSRLLVLAEHSGVAPPPQAQVRGSQAIGGKKEVVVDVIDTHDLHNERGGGGGGREEESKLEERRRRKRHHSSSSTAGKRANEGCAGACRRCDGRGAVGPITAVTVDSQAWWWWTGGRGREAAAAVPAAAATAASAPGTRPPTSGALDGGSDAGGPA